MPGFRNDVQRIGGPVAAALVGLAEFVTSLQERTSPCRLGRTHARAGDASSAATKEVGCEIRRVQHSRLHRKIRPPPKGTSY